MLPLGWSGSSTAPAHINGIWIPATGMFILGELGVSSAPGGACIQPPVPVLGQELDSMIYPCGSLPTWGILWFQSLNYPQEKTTAMEVEGFLSH